MPAFKFDSLNSIILCVYLFVCLSVCLSVCISFKKYFVHRQQGHSYTYCIYTYHVIYSSSWNRIQASIFLIYISLSCMGRRWLTTNSHRALQLHLHLPTYFFIIIEFLCWTVQSFFGYYYLFLKMKSSLTHAWLYFFNDENAIFLSAHSHNLYHEPLMHQQLLLLPNKTSNLFTENSFDEWGELRELIGSW